MLMNPPLPAVCVSCGEAGARLADPALPAGHGGKIDRNEEDAMEIRDLPLAQARAGMVLSGELRDAQGQVLLPDGTVLTPAMLASLARHGIDTLPVRNPHGERIDYLFRKLDEASADGWAVSALRKCLHDYRSGAAE
jgi:hypothetical protein